MAQKALDELDQTYKRYIETPTQKGQEALMTAAADYREEWIEFKAAGGPMQKSRTTHKEAASRWKKIVSVERHQPDGTELALSLQIRTKTSTDYSWYVVSWRTRLSPGGANRRFYFTKNDIWTIDARLALEMFEELKNLGGLDEKYFDKDRNPKFKVTVSSEMAEVERSALFEESTMAGETWGENPNFIALNDPIDDRRKILIVNREIGEATFRSTTKDGNYMPRKVLREGSEWYLDNSMQDTNVQQARVFLEKLRTIVPNLPNSIKPIS